MTTAVPPSRPSERPITVLLVDDQPIVAESVRRMLANDSDIVFHYCQDPTKAIEIANQVQPTVILQDLVMPEIDGLMLVKFFRANKPTRDIPMIVLSSKEEPVIKAEAFKLGANDYLVKLPDKLEVLARLRYHSRGYIAQLERNEAYHKLAESQRELALEINNAARYVQSLLPKKIKGDINIDWKFVPSAHLGGDMFGYHWIDKENFALYLLDVSGHGVGSSLLAVSAANVLSNRSLPDTDFRDPGQVLTGLNGVFQMERQDNQYFTIWYGVFNKTRRELAYSNGGHPDILLHTGPDCAGASLHQLASTDPLIGMLPEGVPFETKTVKLGAYARLLLYSDGAFEIEDPKGVMWEFPQFVEFVAGLLPADQSLIEPLLEKARTLRGQEMFADDFSLIEVRL
ncbi:MAG: SpoIIE family protein phosphatase [Gemmataceae bacterium]